MTHIGRYLYKGSHLWESCTILIILTEKELCQVKTYGNMYIINGNLTLITFCLGNLKNPHICITQYSFHTLAKDETGCSDY